MRAIVHDPYRLQTRVAPCQVGEILCQLAFLGLGVLFAPFLALVLQATALFVHANWTGVGEIVDVLNCALQGERVRGGRRGTYDVDANTLEMVPL
jgi:hypothetical protein